MKITNRTKIIIVVPVILVLLYLAFNITKGTTFIIETNEPAEDFVVLCTKSRVSPFAHTGGYITELTKVIVTESGKKESCGYFIGGEPGVLRIKHPTLVGNGKKHYTKDGVLHRVFDRTKLDLLEEQKAKFEAGYWDKRRWPMFEYALSLRDKCGFGNNYFVHYRQIREVDVSKFKLSYDEPMTECYHRIFFILNQHAPNSYVGKRPSAKEWMNKTWENL